MFKECGCGKQHTEIPADARPDIQNGVIIAYCWECDGSVYSPETTEAMKAAGIFKPRCGSTLYFYKFSLAEIKALTLEGVL